MKLVQLYNLLGESTETKPLLSQLRTLQRRVRQYARKSYKTHLSGDMFPREVYLSKLKDNWSKYQQIKQEYIDFISNNRDAIFSDAHISDYVTRFKNENPDVFINK